MLLCLLACVSASVYLLPVQCLCLLVCYQELSCLNRLCTWDRSAWCITTVWNDEKSSHFIEDYSVHTQGRNFGNILHICGVIVI